MNRTSMLRALAVAAVATLPITGALGAGPATAAQDQSSAKWSGNSATAQWVQDNRVSGDPLPGNYHVGYLDVFEESASEFYVYGGIEDWECPAGELPGGHGEEGGCQFAGKRQIFADADSVAFAADDRLAGATLTGTLAVGGGHGGHDEPEPAPAVSVPINLAWTGTGGTARMTETHRYVDADGSSFTYRTRSQRREATLSGIMGQMPFDAASSSGTLSSYRSVERMRG